MTQHRRLVMFPDRPGQPRAEEAARFAKDLAGSGLAVKLFVEGVRPSQARNPSERLPFPACVTSHEVLEKASAIVDTVKALHTLNAYMWKKAKQSPAGLDLIKICVLRYLDSCGGIRKNLNLEHDARKVVRFLYDDCISTGKRLTEFGFDAGKILTTVGEEPEVPIPSYLGRISRELLVQISIERMDGVILPLRSEMTAYFKDAHGIPIITEEPIHTASLLPILEKDTDPVEAAGHADGVSFYLFSMRKMFMAYRITVETCDHSVVSMDTARIEKYIYALFFRMGMDIEKK
jgi:hypothetical protein